MKEMSLCIGCLKRLESLQINLRSWAYKNKNITDAGLVNLFDGIFKLVNLKHLDLGIRGY